MRLAPSADNTILEIRGPCRIILQFSASFCTPRRTARRSGSTVAGWLRRCQQNDVRRQTPGHWTTGCQTKKGIIKPKIIKQQNWHRAIEHWARMRSSDNENCGNFPVTTAARPYMLVPVPHFLMGTEAMKSIPSSSLQHHVHTSSITESTVVIIAKIWFQG